MFLLSTWDVCLTTALAEDVEALWLGKEGFNSMVAFSTTLDSSVLAKPNMPIISNDTLLPVLINQGHQNGLSEIELKGHYSWHSSRVPIKPKCHPDYTYMRDAKDQSLIKRFHSKLTFKLIRDADA